MPGGTEKTARILAIDYGRKRIGLALSDPIGLTAHPLAVFARTNRRSDLRRLRDLCHEHGLARIIVGHPLNINGTPGEMADEAARFAARLEKEVGIPTELFDERLTSWEAKQTVADVKSKRRNGEPVDDLAAAILLRDYLDKHGRTAAGRKA
ncbi:MAG: Holliday junction resolvase RuvX [Candidatus Acidiferrales bacterium]